MNISIDERELAAEVSSRLCEQLLPAIAPAVAEAVLARLDVLTPSETAALLGVTTRTLSSNASAYGLDKSVSLGSASPRYSLKQVLEALAARKINSRQAA